MTKPSTNHNWFAKAVPLGICFALLALLTPISAADPLQHERELRQTNRNRNQARKPQNQPQQAAAAVHHYNDKAAIQQEKRRSGRSGIKWLEEGIDPIPYENCIPYGEEEPSRSNRNSRQMNNNNRQMNNKPNNGRTLRGRTRNGREKRNARDQRQKNKSGRRGRRQTMEQQQGMQGNNMQMNNSQRSSRSGQGGGMGGRLPTCPNESFPSVVPTAPPSVFPTDEGSGDLTMGPTSLLPPCPPSFCTIPSVSPEVPPVPSVAPAVRPSYFTLPPGLPPSVTLPPLPPSFTIPPIPPFNLPPSVTLPPIFGGPGSRSHWPQPPTSSVLTEVVVPATIEYGFFDTTTPRAPTEEEIQGLIGVTTRFYRDLFSNEYTNVRDAFVVFVGSCFEPSLSLPVKIDFDVKVYFEDVAPPASPTSSPTVPGGTTAPTSPPFYSAADKDSSTGKSTVPSQSDVFAVMDGANYQNYIQDYVWNSEPVGTSIFFETQQIQFNARGGFEPTSAPDQTPSPTTCVCRPESPTGSPSPTSTSGPTPAGLVLVESRMKFRFFDVVEPRLPTDEEVDGLLFQTSRFYFYYLSTVFPNLEGFVAVLVDKKFDPNDALPVTIDFDAFSGFGGGKVVGASIPTATEVLAAMEAANYEDYIMNYVWQSEPLFTTIFFETQEVAYFARAPAPPTTSPLPTSLPSATPTAVPATSAPTTTVSVTVESTIDYRMFENVSPRPPSFSEVVSLLDQTSRFYSDLFRDTYSNFDTFVASLVGESFNASSVFPIKIDFDANLFFAEGTTAPDPYDVFMVMQLQADYLEYIADYVWLTEPVGESIFWEVQEVKYSSRQFTVAPTSSPSPSTPHPTYYYSTNAPTYAMVSPTLAGATNAPSTETSTPTTTGVTSSPTTTIVGTTVRILVESQLQYSFFDNVTPRQPTQEELDGLMVQTTRFYTNLLSAEYPTSFESFDATFVNALFCIANNLPVLIDFDANAFFFDGTTIPTAAEVFNVMDTANYANYIQAYVWNSEPVGSSIFFETQEVAYDARVPDRPSDCPTTAPTTVGATDAPSSTTSASPAGPTGFTDAPTFDT